MIKKQNYFSVISAISLSIGLLVWNYISNSIKDFDKNRWIFLLTMALPLTGIVAGTISILQVSGYKRILAVLFVLMNLGLAAILFLSYAFTYWEF